MNRPAATFRARYRNAAGMFKFGNFHAGWRWLADLRFRSNRFGLRTFRPIGDREADALSFGERLESLALNRAEVDKNVRTVLAGNEAKTLGIIEPFDRTLFAFRHGDTP